MTTNRVLAQKMENIERIEQPKLYCEELKKIIKDIQIEIEEMEDAMSGFKVPEDKEYSGTATTIKESRKPLKN